MYASFGNENLFDEDYNRDKKYSQQLEKYPNKYAIYWCWFISSISVYKADAADNALSGQSAKPAKLAL